MIPGSIREIDLSSPFDGSSDDLLRRTYRLNQRSLFAVIRDWFRGYADVDLLSYDAKGGRFTPIKDYTPAELRAAYFRRVKWTNTY